MRYIVILFALSLYLSSAAQTVEQKKAAREAIKTFMAQKYPSAKERLILEENGGYRRAFRINDHRYTAEFSLNGNWLRTQEHLKLAELPAQVRNTFDAGKYSNTKIYSVLKITAAKKPRTSYMVEVGFAANYRNPDADNTPVQAHQLYFNSTGHLTKDVREPNQSLPYVAWGDD